MATPASGAQPGLGQNGEDAHVQHAHRLEGMRSCAPTLSPPVGRSPAPSLDFVELATALAAHLQRCPKRHKHVPSVAAVIRNSRGREAFTAGYPSAWGECGATRATQHLYQRMSNPTCFYATTASSLIRRSRL